MGLLNKISSFFINNNKNENNTQNKNVSNVMKSLFTKNDPLSLTEFPYDWEKEFFPPLDNKEKKYIKDEIIRWYRIYIDISMNNIIDAVMLFSLKPSSLNEWSVTYYKEYPEEFKLLVQDIVEENLFKFIQNKLNNYQDIQLIKWKPIKKDDIWEPDQKEISPILKDLSEKIIIESENRFKQHNEELEKILANQNANQTIEEKKILIQNTLEQFLHKNKRELIKHTYDRLLLEWNAFPHYYGKTEKVFKNDLYNKYRLHFGITSYNELVGKAFIPLSKFINTHGKTEVKYWLEEQWYEYVHFMIQEHINKDEKELFNISINDFNKYSFAIDYYALMLFKISIDNKM